MGAHLFTWLSVIPGLSRVPSHIFHAGLVTVLLVVLGFMATRRLRRGKTDILPDPGLNLFSFSELVTEMIDNMVTDVIGAGGRKYVPLIGTLALFIFTSNMLGLIPGFAPPTDNLNATAACALTVFFAYHFFGIREHGLKYIKQFTGPIWWLAPLMLPIEIIGHAVRPISLSLRLMGNIMGDHLVLSLFVAMVPFVVPIPIMGLGIFVAIVQTLVFILLSMAYIGGAVSHEGH